MADTDTEIMPNGNATLTEEEEERLKQRPADIDADVREMERRKRVEALMSSRLFREELERVLDQQINEGGDAPLLQRIREMVGGRLHTGSLRGPSCVLPINDIRGIEGVGYEKGEKILRCKLAAVYRLVDLFGWTQSGLSGQITARLNTAVEQMLTTPRGVLAHEVTASSLVKVDMQGIVHDQGTTNFPPAMEGFALHAGVHAARPDVRCVLHLRSSPVLAVSSTRRGLLPLCREAAMLGEVAVHPHIYANNGPLDNEEQEKLVRILGPSARVLLVGGDGALCCGATLEEAFHLAKLLHAAADLQLRLQSLPQDDLLLLSSEDQRQIYEASRKPPAEAGKWRVGGEEFEALMRMLDNAGFRTGYIYRNPLVKNDVPKPKNDVEVPPAVSSLGYLLEEEELYKQGIWKRGVGGRGERSRWLTSPNVYQKVELLETGTHDPKKITKWVQDGSPAHSSTPVKIDTLQFVPKNTNPKEFKALQQLIKENRRADKISAGPQSHILEGVTWDEANKLVEDAVNTHTGDHVVLMGAASKGIIQRGYQHHAGVYSAPYTRNPFDHVSDTEIDEYRRVVERKQRPDYDTDLSESEALSGAQITSPGGATSCTEDETREEHRVVRIETAQAPVRSQPELVLSDVDTTDFLAAERAHADRTRGTVLTKEATSLKEALSTSKRSVHDYPRSTAFDILVKRYDSLEKPHNSHPKCKTNLTSRLNTDETKANALEIYNPGIYGSRSSLCSIPSIEWDGKCRSDNMYRTQSLPRQRRNVECRHLFRTRSHGGFINALLKDPAPVHYHLPKCKACGEANLSYAWELSREEQKGRRKQKGQNLYLSVDNIHQKCLEEATVSVVTVKENFVPMLKVSVVNKEEFVESQEFTEDHYIGEIGSSFSSQNQTVIEKSSPVTRINDIKSNVVDLKTETVDDKENTSQLNTDVIYRAECAQIDSDSEKKTDDFNNSFNSGEGEYHSFSEEMDFEENVYESPVKDLVEKDIRDYSVPIKVYCEEYTKSNDGITTKKSPLKKRDFSKTAILEPILEESKTSYTDDSSNFSNNDSNNNITKLEPGEVISDLLNELVSKVAKVVELKLDLYGSRCDKVTLEMLESKLSKDGNLNNDENSEFASYDIKSATDTIQTALDVYTDSDEIAGLNENYIVDSISNQVMDILVSNVIEVKEAMKSSPQSLKHSLGSTENDIVSFDSTGEFEKFELIADLVSSILDKIDYEIIRSNNSFLHIDQNQLSKKVLCFEANNLTNEQDSYDVSDNLHLNVNSSVEESTSSGFSITKLIENIENNMTTKFNDTVVSEISETDVNPSIKVVEPIVYYIISRVFTSTYRFNKTSKKKKVVTVVDTEDILYTCKFSWLDKYDSSVTDTSNNMSNDSDLKYVDRSVVSIEVISNETKVNSHSNNNIEVLYSATFPDQDSSDSSLKEVSDERSGYLNNDLINKISSEKNGNWLPDDDCDGHVISKESTKYSSNVSTFVDINSKATFLSDMSKNSFDLNSNNIHKIKVDETEVVTESKNDGPAVDSNHNEFEGQTQIIYTSPQNWSEKDDSSLGLINYDEKPKIESDYYVAGSSCGPLNSIIEKNISSSKFGSEEIEFLSFKDSGEDSDMASESMTKDYLNSKVNVVPEENNNDDSDYVVSDLDNGMLSDSFLYFKEYSITEQNASETTSQEIVEAVSNNPIEIEKEDEYISEESLKDTCSEVNNNTVGEHLVNESSFEDNSQEFVNEVIEKLLEKSFRINAEDLSVIDNHLNGTFVKNIEDMNTAFLEDNAYSHGRSSSPHREITILDTCTVSPIKNPNNNFVGADLTVLYEKDDILMGSPFVKKAAVISMSQTQHTGGIKYWISFDEHLTESANKSDFSTFRPSKKYEENKLPSFVSFNTTPSDQDCSTNDTWDTIEKIKFRRSSMLIDSPNNDTMLESNYEIYGTPSNNEYYTCDSELVDSTPRRNEAEGLHKRLLYNSRIDLYSKSDGRKYSSWPPFDNTLFYRLISKFRMSESFDPSDLDNNGNSSL